jgi:two-component system CheB/CheR fusion protein
MRTFSPPDSELPALSELPAEPRPCGERLRVLIIEDNRDAADSLQILLECLGHEAAVAYSGPEGVRLALAWQPDVVLADIGLPGLNGWQVAEQLRRDPALSQARLIAVTGYGTEADRARSRQAGFDYHLTKPCDPADLRGLLGRRNGSAQS